MFGWIEHIFSRGASIAVDAILSLVHTVVRGVYGFLHDIFRLQWDSWNALWNAAHLIARGLPELVGNIYNLFWRILRKLLPDINVRITVNNTRINLRVDIAVRDYNTKISNETRDRKNSILSLLAWIISHVLKPLSALIGQLFKWVLHEGATMWHFFTHLQEFAELLFWFIIHSLEKHAWEVGKFLGEFFLSLLVHNLLRFAKLMEDVIDAVL